MGRDYRAIRKTKSNKLVYCEKTSFGINIAGARFWGFVWDYFGLSVDILDSYSSKVVQLPHIIDGEDFVKAKELFLTITDEQILEALQYAGRKFQYDIDETQGWVKDFRKDVIPLFFKKNAIAVVSDYIDLKELGEEYGKKLPSYP
jgi:hypothetical protein